MQRIHSSFILFVLVFLVLPCYPQQTGDISPVEAIHLVEYILEQETPGIRLLTYNMETLTFRNNPVYIVEGKSGQDGYRATVDACVARVISITKNDKPLYQWQGIKVVGHRGSVKFAPENTIPAFEAAIRYGADLVEMDIRETKDGELVIMHDGKVDRTTNGSGKVADLTLAEIKNLDAGSWFGSEFTGVKVPTFKEVLKIIRGRALPDIDFKAGSPDKLIKILKEEDLLGKVTLYCGNWDLLRETLMLSDGFIIRPTVPNGYSGLPVLINELNPPIVNINWEEFSEKLVRETHIAGKKSFLNVMQHDNEFAILQMINTMPDYLQSDNLDILLPILRAKGLHK